MSKYEDTIDALVNRAFEKRCDNLASIIESEKLCEYELGHVDIIYADSINYAVVPCEEYMILAHEHYNYDEHKTIAEYAVYKQYDRDGAPLRNSLNMNAVYRLSFIGIETFTNMAYAIAYASELIKKITEDEKEN